MAPLFRITRRLMPLTLLGVFSCVPLEGLTGSQIEPEGIVDSKLTSTVVVRKVPAEDAVPRRPKFEPIKVNFSPKPQPSPTPKPSADPGTGGTGGTGGTDGTGGTGGTADTEPDPDIAYEGAYSASIVVGGLYSKTPEDGAFGQATLGVNRSGGGLALVSATKLMFPDATDKSVREIDLTASRTASPVQTDLTAPAGCVYDSVRKVLYVSEPTTHVIKRVALVGNTVGVSQFEVHVIAGIEGTPGVKDGKGIATDVADKATLTRPTGLALVGDMLYVADTGSHSIRAIDVSKTAEYPVTLVAGTKGTAGKPASATATEAKDAAKFDSPHGLAAGKIGARKAVFVADTNNHCIRAIDVEEQGSPTDTGRVTVHGGTLTAGGKDGDPGTSTFNKPFALAADDANNVYVGEFSNFRIRKIAATGRKVTTLSGKGPQGNATGPNKNATYELVVALAATKDAAGKTIVYAFDAGPVPDPSSTEPQSGPRIVKLAEQ